MTEREFNRQFPSCSPESILDPLTIKGEEVRRLREVSQSVKIHSARGGGKTATLLARANKQPKTRLTGRLRG